MKPRKAILTLAAVTALFSAGGCDLNNNVAVYGPPPDDYTTVARPAPVQTITFDPADNIPQDVYGSTVDLGESTYEDTFEPEYNIAETVYGPPVSMEERAETAETSETSETSDTADTADTDELQEE